MENDFINRKLPNVPREQEGGSLRKFMLNNYEVNKYFMEVKYIEPQSTYKTETKTKLKCRSFIIKLVYIYGRGISNRQITCFIIFAFTKHVF